MDKAEQTNNIENEFNGSNLTEFVELVACIMDYYGNEGKNIDPSERWRGEEKIIPEEIDSMVSKAFIKQLKKFT